MPDAMVLSDTYFTRSPDWGWLIVFYFFFGGLSGGTFFLAALLDLFGRPEDRRLARIGYVLSLIMLLPCPPLLIIDLNRPERFWHMLLENNTMQPMFKLWSPMSFGAWVLAVFSLFSALAFLGALAEERPTSGFGRLGALGRGGLGKVIAALGAILGLTFAGYTGVLLSVTNRAIWADTNWIGALFLASSATTSAALLAWIGRTRAATTSMAWLGRLEVWFALLELLVLALVVITLGPVAREWMSGWGVLLVVGVVLLGLFVPLLLRRRPLLGARTVPVAAALSLAGGLILRIVVILSGENA